MKATGKCCVSLEIFLVFRPRCCRNRAQLATGQGWLQDVRRIVLPGLPACSNQIVRLINEQNDGSGAGPHFFNQLLNSIFELASNPGTRLQQSQIQYVDRYIGQRRRNFATGNAQRQTFHNCRLTHSGLARKDRIILPTTHQNVDDLPDFLIAPKNGINPTSSGFFSQIFRISIQIRSVAGRLRLRGWSCFFGGNGSAGRQILAKRFHGNLRKFIGDFFCQTPQFRVGHQRQHTQTTGDFTSAMFHGTKRPGLGEGL